MGQPLGLAQPRLARAQHVLDPDALGDVAIHAAKAQQFPVQPDDGNRGAFQIAVALVLAAPTENLIAPALSRFDPARPLRIDDPPVFRMDQLLQPDPPNLGGGIAQDLFHRRIRVGVMAGKVQGPNPVLGRFHDGVHRLLILAQGLVRLFARGDVAHRRDHSRMAADAGCPESDLGPERFPIAAFGAPLENLRTFLDRSTYPLFRLGLGIRILA